MSNYLESAVTGQAWQRCCQIVIDNRRHITPSVRFEEEQVVALDIGEEIRKPAAGITLDFDPAREIPLRDPATGELTGQSTTYADAYALLFSAYLAAALERDAKAQPTAPETTPQE